MKRALEYELQQWRNATLRTPLILRGARQVGKTHLLRHFGKQAFKHLLEINFEKRPEFSACFESFEPQKIIDRLSQLSGEQLVPGESLLFLDEIQECPRAISALRYFKEEMPNYHVAAAGSLLEFALRAPDFKMPVGRVQYLYLQPFSFKEFLCAKGKGAWVTSIESSTLTTPLDDAIHQLLNDEVRQYMRLGGMPEILKSHLLENETSFSLDRPYDLLKNYSDDFGKYGTRASLPHIKKVYERLPDVIGQQLKYSKLDPESRSRELSNAIECLSSAGLVYPTYHSSSSGLPLSAQKNHKKFKLYFVDTGLMSASKGITAETILNDEVLHISAGMLAEQFVAQELVAYQPARHAPALYYWSREKKSSSAEVDFVIQVNESIVPIEVKSGTTGRLRSLQQMMSEKELPTGIQLSQQPLAYDSEKHILSVPLYMVGEISRLVNALH